jgi:hypothetical protein
MATVKDTLASSTVRLAEQWSEILAGLPRGWEAAWLALTVEDEDVADRVALILGPAAPGRVGSTFRLNVDRRGHGLGPGPALTRRVLARLDREGIRGRLELVETTDVEAAAEAGGLAPAALSAQWEALLDALPRDWSHLYAQIDLDSSDFLDRAALLLAPVNPSLSGGSRSFRFRAASRVGYGAAAGMVRRCLARLGEERITGRIRIVQVVSDDRPFATQGPVWRIGGKSV